MTYKLMAIDMDGTLLNSENRISKRTKASLEKASANGKYTVIATGRMLKSAVNYSNNVGIKRPIIAGNGSVIVDEDRNLVYGAKIDYSVVERVMEIAEEEGAYFHFYGLNEIYSPVIVEEIIDFYNDEDTSEEEYIRVNKVESLNDLEKLGNPNVYKFLFIDPNENKDGQLDRVRERLEKLNELNISSSWSNNLEVTRKDVSKGNSLAYLSEKLGVKKEEVIAIGDNYNDVSMFENAGLKVAMENGEKEIKEMADIIADTNDNDGVAKIIEKYLI